MSTYADRAMVYVVAEREAERADAMVVLGLSSAERRETDLALDRARRERMIAADAYSRGNDPDAAVYAARNFVPPELTDSAEEQ